MRYPGQFEVRCVALASAQLDFVRCLTDSLKNVCIGPARKSMPRAIEAGTGVGKWVSWKEATKELKVYPET